MRASTVIAVVVAILVLGGAYWYWSSTQLALPGTQAGLNGTENEGQPNGGAAQPGNVTPGPTLLRVAATTTLGQYLVAQNGMTLYTFDSDSPGVSNCSGECAVNWPPYTVGASETVQTPAGLSGTVATLNRTDGSLQVTYNGNPLYFYKNDAAVGDTKGQGVSNVWFVIKP